MGSITILRLGTIGVWGHTVVESVSHYFQLRLPGEACQLAM